MMSLVPDKADYKSEMKKNEKRGLREGNSESKDKITFLAAGVDTVWNILVWSFQAVWSTRGAMTRILQLEWELEEMQEKKSRFVT